MDLIKLYKKSDVRIKIFQILAIVVFLYLTLGLIYRQIIQYKAFLQKERQQSIRRIIIPAARGNIYDRNGNVLVCNRPVFSLELYLNELQDEFREKFLKETKYYIDDEKQFDRNLLRTKIREQVVNKILKDVNNLLECDLYLSGTQIDRHIAQRSLLPVTIISDLSIKNYDKLINFLPLNSPLQIGLGSTRCYPNNKLACHILGYTVSEENKLCSQVYNDNVYTFKIRQQIGKTGVEKSANDILKGKSGYETWVVNPSGEKYTLDKKVEPKNGDSIFLSIDKDLQKVVEDALGSYFGCAIIIDVNTNEILAMASSPAYDPNLLYPTMSQSIFREINEYSGWFNQAIQGLFPPASTFKLISAIAFLKSEEIDPNEKLLCTGLYTGCGRKWKCNNHKHGEEIDLHLALGKSCNTYVFDRAAYIGANLISQEAKNFGLNKQTGIDLPYETKGMVVPDVDWKIKYGFGDWSLGDTLNLSIGQGYVLTTPLNICCFTASLAKNRLKTKPTIFKQSQISDDISNNEKYLPDDIHHYIVEAMIDCVDNYTGKRAKIDGIAVAGKTGSAQFKEHGKSRNIAWFTCFAPAYAPEIAVTVMVREDRDGLNYHGGTQAAPIANKILRKYFMLD